MDLELLREGLPLIWAFLLIAVIILVVKWMAVAARPDEPREGH